MYSVQIVTKSADLKSALHDIKSRERVPKHYHVVSNTFTASSAVLISRKDLWQSICVVKFFVQFVKGTS